MCRSSLRSHLAHMHDGKMARLMHHELEADTEHLDHTHVLAFSSASARLKASFSCRKAVRSDAAAAGGATAGS